MIKFKKETYKSSKGKIILEYELDVVSMKIYLIISSNVMQPIKVGYSKHFEKQFKAWLNESGFELLCRVYGSEDTLC
jgi:hypothetical protein